MPKGVYERHNSEAPRAPKEINVLLNKLADAVTALDGSLTELEKQLEPVSIATAMPDPDSTGAASTKIGAVIIENTAHVNALTARVIRMISGLEV